MNLNVIHKELNVDAGIEKAFNVFTHHIDLWWPRQHHIGRTPMVELVLEPKVNGRWYSRHEDGSEATVGYVQTWKPFDELVLIWQVNGQFKFDPTLHTEVVIHFYSLGDNTTKIVFEHRNLERLGDGGKTFESMDTGWGMILDLFKQNAHSK